MSDRHRWEERHRQAPGAPEASAFLRRIEAELPRGLCLDLACGRGGNSRLLAGAGFRVEAIDWSFEAVRSLGSTPGVHPIVADLRSFPLPAGRYDVVVCFRYLERSIWPAMERALRPGGALVFETMTEAFRVRNPGFSARYCLRPGELGEAFPRLRRAYQEESDRGIASLLAFRDPG